MKVILKNIHEYLLACNKPQTLVSIGATRYTEFGQTNYLKKNDVSIVVVYPEDLTDSIESIVAKRGIGLIKNLCISTKGYLMLTIF